MALAPGDSDHRLVSEGKRREKNVEISWPEYMLQISLNMRQ